MTLEEKELLFRALSGLYDTQIKILEGLRLLDSYERESLSDMSYKLWQIAENLEYESDGKV